MTDLAAPRVGLDASGDPIAATLGQIAQHLLRVEVPAVGGTLSALRERNLASAVQVRLGGHLATTVGETVITVPGWSSMGRGGTDFVVPSPGGLEPVHVGELKWCTAGADKVHEGIWDLFKMALASRIPSVRTAHLITGAPTEMWATAFCADIFDGGTFAPAELCLRRFPRGRRRTVWDWLLEGGYDRFPKDVPGRIRTTPVTEPCELAGPGGAWQLRAVRVEAIKDVADVHFVDGWPHGARPADARRPLLTPAT